MSSTIRNYNGMLDRWELIGADAGTGLQDLGTAHLVGNEMHIEQRFGVMSPQPSLWRIRYYAIQPERFSWTADRSLDDGRTWTREYLTIQARRIGPTRTMGPIAVARHRSRPNRRTTIPWRRFAGASVR